MKKYVLVLLMVMIVLTGCGKKTIAPKAVTTVDVKISYNGKNLNMRLNADVDDNYISHEVNSNSALITLNEDTFKDMDILDSLKKVMELGVSSGLVTNDSSISIDVHTLETKNDLYRYLYKNALEPLNDSDISVEIDFKFNE